MPRRNRNALRGGTRPPYDGQLVMTADEPDDFGHLLTSAWTSFAAGLDAAADSAAAPAAVHATAGTNIGSRR